MEYGEILKKRLDERCVCYAKLARHLDITPQYLNFIFTGSRKPSLKLHNKFNEFVVEPIPYFH
jgi:plasmid maintenance system antidote protein VapI